MVVETRREEGTGRSDSVPQANRAAEGAAGKAPAAGGPSRAAVGAFPFYGRAEEAVGLASRDALEVFILAVVLGFRGIFRDQLPSLRQWLRTQEQLVRVGDGRPPLPDTAPELSGAPPLSGGSRLLWASLVATMVTACVFVAAWRIVMR